MKKVKSEIEQYTANELYKSAKASVELDHYRKNNNRTRRICNGFDLKGCTNDSVKTEDSYGFCHECYEKRAK